MTSYKIDDEVSRALEEIAQAEDRSVDELVNDVLRHFAKTRAARENAVPPVNEAHEAEGSLFLMLAELAEQYDWRSGRSDVSENFDEIIGDMMAKDFLKRHHADDSA